MAGEVPVIDKVIQLTRTMYVSVPSPRQLEGAVLFSSHDECEAHNRKLGRDWPIFTVEVTVTL